MDDFWDGVAVAYALALSGDVDALIRFVGLEVEQSPAFLQLVEQRADAVEEAATRLLWAGDELAEPLACWARERYGC